MSRRSPKVPGTSASSPAVPGCIRCYEELILTDEVMRMEHSRKHVRRFANQYYCIRHSDGVPNRRSRRRILGKER